MIPKQEAPPAPEFGRSWFNSGDLSLAALRGRVVLVDFWDYTCVNCLRTLPYLTEWHNRYREKGLTVIGVHAPEFGFARRADFVERAVRELGIRYPVVLDNDFVIWRLFGNRFWPAKYLIDNDGLMRLAHFGEGAYAETEAAIQDLLKELNPQVELPPLLPPVRESDQPGAVCYPVTPELYLGHRRGRLGNDEGFQRDAPADYKLPAEPPSDVCSLEGRWLSRDEHLESAAAGGLPARLVLPYMAKEVNLVMAPTAPREFIVTVRQDGAPLAARDAGADIEFIGEEASLLRVRSARMFRLVNNAEFGTHRLELEVAEAGLALYAFTFISCPTA